MHSINKMELDIIASINIFLYYFIWFLYLLTGFTFFFFVQIFLGLLPVLYVLMTKKIKWNIFSFILIIAFFLILSSLINKNLSLINIIINLHYPFLSILIIDSKLNYKVFFYSFWFYFLFFGSFLIFGANPNIVFATSSRNYISVVMIIQVTLLYISNIKAGKNISIFPALATILLSVWGIGRSGIASSLILFLGVLIHKGIKNKLNFKKTTTNFFLLLLTLIILNIIVNPKYLLNLYTSIEIASSRFSTLNLFDDARFVILDQYVNTLDNFKNIIFGTNISELRIMQVLNNNTHNSYLRLHMSYGIGGFAIYILGIFLGYLKLIKNRAIVFLFIFTALLMRIATDTIALPGVLDPLIIYFIFQDDISTTKRNID